MAGLNEQGQLGLNENVERRCKTPTHVPLDRYMNRGDLAIKVQCGHDHTLVLTSQGCVYGFGR